MKKILLTLLGVLHALPIFAYYNFEYLYEGTYFDIVVANENRCYIRTTGMWIEPNLIIPPSVFDGEWVYTVTEIGQGAFSNTRICKVTIPNSINIIGQSAFEGCTSLTAVDIPNSVRVIRASAFKNCTALSKVSFDNSVKSSIGDYAFYNCSGLTQVTIPNSITSIGEEAFKGCSGLTEITVEASTPPSIERNTFDGLYNTATLIIPDGSLDAYISSNWGQFKNIKINYLTFDDGALTYHLNAIDKTAIVTGANTSAITIPEYITDKSDPGNPVTYSVTGIGDEAFKGKTIESFAFNSRSKLEYIGKSAFAESTLPAISLPETVKTIGSDAFKGCSSLTKAEFVSIEALCAIEFGNVDANPLSSIKHLYIGDEEVTNLVIPESVTSIGNYAFYNCSGLTSVIIPNSVTSIGWSAFNGCSGLKKSAYPNTLRDPFPTGTCVAYNPDGATIENDVIFGPDKTSILFAPISLSGEYVIPESVTSIGENAFCYCPGLTSVTIPNSVTSIGNSAFYGCSRLNQVTIPNSVKSIGWRAFNDCSGLTKAEFASIESLCAIEFENAWANPLYYAKHLYIGGKEVTEVVIPESVTAIGNYAFDYCSGLTQVIIPNSVKSIGEDAFNSCYSLTKAEFASIEALCAIEFSNNWANPLYYAKHLYIGGKEVTEVVIPESVTAINDTFVGGSYLKSVTIPNSVKSIGDHAFSDCSGLTHVTIPNSVTSIGVSAFSRCTGLTEVFIPNSVTTIGSYAFYKCSGLTQVAIGNSVTSIGSEAFEDCSGLTEIIVEASTPASINENSFSGRYDTATLTIPEGSLDAYESSNWGQFKNIKINDPVFDDGVLTYRLNAINKTAIVIGASTSAITIPERVTDASDPDNPVTYSVTGIGDWAFMGKAIESFAFDSRSKLEYIGKSAFAESTLPAIALPETVKTIGTNAFYNCKNLTKAEFASIESLCAIDFRNAYANPLFYVQHLYIGGKEVTEVVIPESVTAIKFGTFYNCTGLTKVTIPNSVTTIGKSAFCYCSGLTQLTIPNSVKSIGAYAFNGCTSLTQVTIPNSVTTIGTQVFCFCRSLTQVTIPNSVTSIGEWAFYGCSGLTDITVEASIPPSIYETSFRGLYDTATLTVPEDSLDAYVSSDWGRFKNIKTAKGSGIREVTIDGGDATGAVDYTAPYEIYNLGGAYLGTDLDTLAPGLYIIRQGNAVEKRIVR